MTAPFQIVEHRNAQGISLGQWSSNSCGFDSGAFSNDVVWVSHTEGRRRKLNRDSLPST